MTSARERPPDGGRRRHWVGGRVVTPSGVLDPGWVETRGGMITDVGSGAAPQPPAAAGDDPPEDAPYDLAGAYLLPGFIDLHMHGGGGHDVNASPADLAAAVAFHARHGTTGTLVSLVTAPVDDLSAQLGWIADLARVDSPGESVRGDAAATGRVLGAHLEGPFLSPQRCGAQNTRYMLEPDPAVLSRLVAAGDGWLRAMTIAAELPGALDIVRDCVAAGMVAALGHSNATYDQAATAIDAGATLATHLFNGMRPLHHREPGLIGAALTRGIASELINDGVHVHPAVTRMVAMSAAPLVLVTDAIAAAGAGDGDYALGGQPVRVENGRARLATTGSLAGSTLTMDEAVRRAVQRSGLPITMVSAAASGTPARVLGIADRVGAILPGLRADFVVLDDALGVVDVVSAGRPARRTGGAGTTALVV